MPSSLLLGDLPVLFSLPRVCVHQSFESKAILRFPRPVSPDHSTGPWYGFLTCAVPFTPLFHPDLWQSCTNASRKALGCLQAYAKPAIYQLGIQLLAYEKCRHTHRRQGQASNRPSLQYNGKKQMQALSLHSRSLEMGHSSIPGMVETLDRVGFRL